jgi:hypothetical protein
MTVILVDNTGFQWNSCRELRDPALFIQQLSLATKPIDEILVISVALLSLPSPERRWG